jgi:hypothetical protein
MRNLHLVHSTSQRADSSTGPRGADRDPVIGPLDPDVRAMLEHVRVIPPLPRSVRARVLARARAVIAAAARPAPAAGRRRARTLVT